MESQNSDEGKQDRIEPKISISKDGKWVIIRVPGIEQAVIKPVAYFEKILQSARQRADSGFAGVQSLK